ncbi:hypothetical protein CQ14_14390 [Bradyrhizobium lablabi]|uniref:Uncharacterized protein n=1 Tax=Bradyrhizobium lablabi TaxID=722472 RepID=A0A0R3MJ10_9BRAD|nr:hypothetical protein CQ14_14390 [Bradyrhizobium lablabi]
MTAAQVDAGSVLNSYARRSLESTPTPTASATATSQVDRALNWLSQNQDQASNAVANAAPALMSQLRGVIGGGVATSTPQAITATSDTRSTGTSTASLASQSYALLNQYLAGSTGRGDSGQIAAPLSNGATAGQTSFLTRPQH